MKIHNKEVGPGNPCFVIAEVGSNHGGSLDEAHRYVDAAADAGADAVKFQTIVLDRFLAGQILVDGVVEPGPLAGASFQSLPDSAWPELFAHAEERGMVGFSAAFDVASVELIALAGPKVFKVASGDVTNTQLLEAVGGTGLPVIVSSGMANLEEIDACVHTLTRAGTEQYALLHCVSEYPTTIDKANVRAIATLRERFEVPTGISDHTMTHSSVLAAVALGAQLVEKHVTFSRSTEGVDHHFAVPMDDFATLVEQIREVEAALGSGIKEPNPDEANRREIVRRGLFATRDLCSGDTVEATDLIALRPQRDYIRADNFRGTVGRTLSSDIAAGMPLRSSDLA